jgi:hypothetical protein
MSGIFDSVLGAIGPGAMQQIAQQIGVDPQKAQGAVNAALPLILGAMGRNAAQPQGAEALHRALQKDHGNVDIGGLLGGLLGGGSAQQSGGGLEQGAAILKHVLGARQERAAVGLGQTTGIGSDGAGKLMQILAPIVMSQLGKMTQQQGMTAGGLGQVLGQAQQHANQQSNGVAGGLLGAVLDRDGDGDVDFADLAPMGASLFGKMFGGGR